MAVVHKKTNTKSPAKAKPTRRSGASSPKAAKKQQVTTRLVLNFPGFEQTGSIAQLGRLHYGATQTGKIWNFSVSPAKTTNVEGKNHCISEISATGKNWQSKTRIVQFAWNDIVHAYERQAFPVGFLKNLPKYFAFFFDGTVGRYRKTSSRYWGFTIFPILLAIIFALISWFFVGALIDLLNFGDWAAITWQIVATILLTLALCKFPGDFLYIPLTIADWAFARDMVNRKNPEIEVRFSEFADIVKSEIEHSGDDEIIIVGHSFGALWAVAALGKALEVKPNLFNGKKITFLALGSSMLKIALAPRAGFMRGWWNSVSGKSQLYWHEIQTKDDWIAFYKCDPFELAEFDAPKGGYHIDRVKFKDGMERARYKNMRKSFYRTHRQYILYYDKRVFFDYMLRLFGPFSARALAVDPQLHKQIDHSGKLV